jgi:hypothetical protein
MVININIVNRRATPENEVVLVCGNSDYTIQFSFDAEWDGLAEKTARFVWESHGERKHADVPITGSSAAVPVLSGTKELLVGVFGGCLRATTPARIPCEYSVRCLGIMEEVTQHDH